MFNDLFDTEEEILTGVKEGQVQSSWDRLPRSCADQLKMPDVQRKTGYPIGLKNIGQTCYLNSLLQILFHTPQLRKIILDLPLCVDTVQNKSDFLNHPSKHRFMMGFQRLFSEMAVKDARALTTQYLKDAFGWQGSEHVQQHDIEEAMKIIFDTFERALQDTEYQKNIKELFRGILSQYKNCRNCTVTTDRLEDFYGLTIPVKGMNSLDQSMLSFMAAESMEGDNKIFCETCESKQDMWLGTRLKVLPKILVFTLRRFTFDYELLDRVKINDLFSFNLQYNLAHLLEDENKDQQYELYGVMIHRGSAHGGHYFCYIRDVMQEADWHKSLQEAKQQKKNEKEYQSEKMPEPSNKKLTENWFCLDDSISQGIDVDKLASKFQGSQSAYILFYRKKDLESSIDIKVPEYFSKIIEAENQVLKKQRQEYQTKKKQIILKIDGKNQLISLDTKIKDFMEIYCPYGYSLVNEAKHNDLPYYPLEINSLADRDQEQNLGSLDLVHESTWIKLSIDSQQYQQIQKVIHKDKMPFEMSIIYSYDKDKSHKIILYQDQILSQLKYKISSKFNIPYEKQIIKLVTPYTQYFVTDDLKNDDVLLTKLGFVHSCQIVLKKVEEKDGDKQNEPIAMEEEGTMYCFVVERDDVNGIKRMYFEKEKTLQQFFEHVIKVQAIPNDGKRRFRNLNGDRLLYADQYEKTLENIKFGEQIVKLRIERGEIPVKGDICIKAKIQSLYKQENNEQQIQYVFDPNTSIADVKAKICEIAKLEPQKHKVYLTDWMGEPVRSLNRQKQSIFDANFGREQIICIRDIESPIGSQLMYLEIYQTLIGSPQDVSAKFPIKLEQTKTLLDLKTQILQSELCKDIPELNPNKIRVRELKRDYMLGNILKNQKIELKSLGLNSNKIVVQILDHEQKLNDNQIVLLLKKRNVEKKIYEGQIEMVFEAGKNPSIQQLMKAVREKLEVSEQEQIKIIKYIHYNFEWLEICEKSIDKFLKGKAKPEGKKKKGKEEEEGQKVQEKQSKEESAKQQHKEQNKKKGKKGKNKNNEPKDKQEARRQQCLNLRRAPFLLKDGDWIGYGTVQELKNDDLQTEEDLTLRFLRQNEKKMGKVYRKGQEKGFKVNLDF